MLLFSVIGREFREAARRKRAHGLRLLFGGAMAGWFCFAALKARLEGAEALGRSVYDAIVLPLAYGLMLVAPALTAPSIATERSAGTLGLLFLTHLRPYHIVLAKFFARLVELLGFVLISLPFLVMPILFGGVERDEVISDAFILFGLIVFCAATGICASAYLRSPTIAFLMALAFVWVLDVALQLPGLFVIQNWSSQLHFFGRVMGSLKYLAGAIGSNYSPGMGLFNICEMILHPGLKQITAGLVDLGLAIGMALVFLSLAAWKVSRHNQLVVETESVRWWRRLRIWNRTGNWVAASVCAVLIFLVGSGFVPPGGKPPVGWFWTPNTGFVMNLVLLVLVARSIAAEKDGAMLESLVCAPLSNFALVNRAILHAWRQCWGWYLLCHAPFLIYQFLYHPSANSIIFVHFTIDTLVDLAAIFGFGSFCSLYARDSARAGAFALVLVGIARFLPEVLNPRWQVHRYGFSSGDLVISLLCLVFSVWVYLIAVKNIRSFAARQ